MVQQKTRNAKKDAHKQKLKRTRSIQEVIDSATFIFPKVKKSSPNKIAPKKQPANKPVVAVVVVAKKGKKAPKNQRHIQQIQQLPTNNNNNNTAVVTQQTQFALNATQQQYFNCENLNEMEFEMDEHRNYKGKFLGKEQAFSNFKTLIFNCNMQDSAYQTTLYEKQVSDELKLRGFKHEYSTKGIEKLMDYDIAWLLSFTTPNFDAHKANILKHVTEFMQAKKGLFLWSDNQPLFQVTNLILEHHFDGMKMVGDYHGDKIIVKSQQQQLSSGTFDGTHPIFYGVNNLHEGITICHPEKIHKDFKIIAYNSEGKPLILVAEANERHGRIILDCGFTKLYTQYWSKAGTNQYVSNANVWLTGLI